MCRTIDNRINNRSEKECSDISIYGSVLVFSNSDLERGSTNCLPIMGQAVIKNRGSSCYTIWIRLRLQTTIRLLLSITLIQIVTHPWYKLKSPTRFESDW